MKSWFAFEDAVGKITRLLAGFCLAVVFVLFLLNILTRVPFLTWNPTWIDEVIQFFLVWMIFLSAAELARIGAHFAVDVLAEKFVFCEVWAETALNNAFCACTVMDSASFRI